MLKPSTLTRTSIAIAIALTTMIACNSSDEDATADSNVIATEKVPCTAAACGGGVEIQFRFQDRGEYVFEVTVDGEKTTCRETLPVAEIDLSAPPACDREGVSIVLGADALEGLLLETTTAKSVTLRVTRDGQLIGSSTKAPPYVTSPGPNGPGCEPATCTSAQYALE